MIMVALGFLWGRFALGQPPDVALERNNQKIMSAKLVVGQHLVLKTAPVPVTGYHWIAYIPDNAIVAQIRAPTLESERKNLPGGLQRTRFDLVARSPGQVVVDVYFLLAAQPATSAVDHFALRISVR
jgi:predicted secreted protein